MKRAKKKKAQNLVEYLLIAAFVGFAGYMFVSRFNIGSLKNYVFLKGADQNNSSQISIEAMTR